MVFSSLEFIYLFLPPVLLGFYLLRTFGFGQALIWWLIVSSLAFYAWWSPAHLLLLLGSVGINYGLHKLLSTNRSKALLTLGIVANIAVLALFKYADFLIENFNAAFGVSVTELGLILPLAISFYTFQQISFLRDSYRGEVIKSGFRHYLLFVTFFPQLIAGPIVMQKDTIPQFLKMHEKGRLLFDVAAGTTLFLIGLFKKIVLADGIAPLANAVFVAADQGGTLSTAAAWGGTLAYTFQIYFDFSGYCDMALGLALMFGIRLPINFNSPYKATSIVEFWRRWHITLSRFLRDYLYIPLGGNRSGMLGEKGNLALTMLLGGLWHGAGWNFVIWGGLHGAFLIISHSWTNSEVGQQVREAVPNKLYCLLTWSLTLLAVMVAWVFFRAETFSGAFLVLQAMFGLQNTLLGAMELSLLNDFDFYLNLLIIMGFLSLCMPNSIEFTGKFRPILDTKNELAANANRWSVNLEWLPSIKWGAVSAVLAVVGVIQIYRLNDLSEFIYFNF